MRKVMKIMFAVATSFALITSVNAGEMTVTGSAKATLNSVSGDQAGRGIGISNELNFGATGELDNGYSWMVRIELDPASGTDSGLTDGDKYSGAALNDDTAFEVTMGDLGMIGLYVSESGMNSKYGFDQSAYTAITDTSVSEGIVYPNDLGSFNSIQYAIPAILPLGITARVGHGVNGGATGEEGSSGNTVGAAAQDTMTAYQVSMAPIDGLKIGASYSEINTYSDGTTTDEQGEENGAYYVTYATGPFSLGYGKSYKAPAVLDGVQSDTGAEYYDNTGVSFAYSVNDALSVSYTHEKSEKNTFTANQSTIPDVKAKSVQAAYTVGGATISVARTDYENKAYVTNDDATETLLAISMAF
jgi:hypothetical protein